MDTNNKIAIIITTFLRNNISYQAVNNIIKYWNKEYIIFYANQSYKTDLEKVNGFSEFCSSISDPAHLSSNHLHYYNLPFDCGLSYARNYLVERAKEHDCKYCLIIADSLHVNSTYDFTNIIAFLESDLNNGIVGFNINNRVAWEYDLELVPNEYFYLKKPRREKIVFNSIEFKPVDICRNFFLAKTTCLLENKWDENLKLTEHESFFWELKQTDWKVYWTDSITCDYISSKSDVYNKYRRRIYKEFLDVLKKKYHIKSWVRYER